MACSLWPTEEVLWNAAQGVRSFEACPSRICSCFDRHSAVQICGGPRTLDNYRLLYAGAVPPGSGC